jgi:phosphatidylserine decarboxylase
MNLLRSAPFLRAYRFFPHQLINRLGRRVARAQRPRWLVQAAMRAWVRRGGIRLDGCVVQDLTRFASLEELFLRRLDPGARPVCARGTAAPVDGRLLAAGCLQVGTRLSVKGQLLSLARIVNGRRSPAPLRLDDYVGGAYAVLFLSPGGYHRVHMPVDGELLDVRWLAGRFFPQNERALTQIAGVYERNERAVVRVRDARSAAELLLVLVGASVVGGIELEGLPRRAWVGPLPVALSRTCGRGDEVGHFTFGSTVVVLAPAGFAGPLLPRIGAEVRMGEGLWDDPRRAPPAPPTALR